MASTDVTDELGPPEVTSEKDKKTNNSKFSCDEPFCEKRFSKKSHLNRHLKVHSGERPYDCSVCGKSYSRREHLSRHELGHTGKWPFVCSYNNCGKAFIDKAHLKRHEYVHDKPYLCDRCGLGYGKFEQLFKHKTRHQFESDPNAVKPYRCIHVGCNEYYDSLSGLKKHLRLHDRPKHYRCEACNVSFVKFGHLVSHRKAVHPVVHKCESCGKEFKRLNNLVEHSKRHRITEASYATSSLLCPVVDCGMSFSSKRSIKVHTRAKHMQCIHFECKICDISFGAEPFFLSHMKKCHGQYTSLKPEEFMVSCVGEDGSHMRCNSWSDGTYSKRCEDNHSVAVDVAPQSLPLLGTTADNGKGYDAIESTSAGDPNTVAEHAPETMALTGLEKQLDSYLKAESDFAALGKENATPRVFVDFVSI